MKPITLGALIKLLEAKDGNSLVSFDFGGFRVTGIDSYRGYYEQLAVGYSEGVGLTVTELLTKLREAVGKTFTGYKGGEYRMGLETPMWAANYSECHSTAIVGLAETPNYAAVLRTECVW